MSPECEVGPHAKVSEPELLVLRATPEGADARTNGAMPDEAELEIPIPELFLPETLKKYVVPFVSPVTEALVLVDTPSANVE